jgi:hypothetical protein
MNRLIFALLLSLVVSDAAFAASPPPTNATVGTASVEVLPARPWNGSLRRTGFAIVNDSDSKIYLAFGAPAEIGKGILLMPNGGAVTLVAGVPETAVYAIAATGETNRLTILEW